MIDLERLNRPRPIPADSRRERQLPSATTSAARRYEMARKTKVSYTNVEMLGKAEYLLLVLWQPENLGEKEKYSAAELS